VPVDSMVSDKDKLQRHAHEALKKEKHPSISFTASDITVATADADSFSVVANGDLTIAGNTHVVQLTAKAFQKSDGSVAVAGTHRLKLSTYDVERPSLFFGTIKVDDPIRLGFDVLLRPTASSPSGTE
jgi:polyisoprenoid-binding protein YceI